MRTGHIITLFGAGLVVVGALFMPWQAFEIADITAPGWAVPGGQVLAALAMLVVLAAALGATGRRQRETATVNVIIAAFSIAWLIAAYVTRTNWFELTPHEVITMASGYTLACWGVTGVALGALTVLAQDPATPAGQSVLRVAMLWGDTVIDERELLRPGQITLGEDANDDITAEVAAALGIHFPLFKATPDGYAMGLDPSLNGVVTVGGSSERVSIQEFMKGDVTNPDDVDDAGEVPFRNLRDGDWGIVELQADIRVFFQLNPVEQRRIHRLGWLAFDEGVTAAIAASAVAQLLFVVWAVVSWTEQPLRVVQHNTSKAMQVEASLHQRRVEVVPEEAVQEQPKETSKAMAEDPGALGDPDEAPEKKTRLKARRVVNPDPPPKDRSILTLLDNQVATGGGPIAEIFGKPDQAFRNKFAIATAGGLTDDIGFGTSNAVGFRGNGRGGGGLDGVLAGRGWDDGVGTAPTKTTVGLKPKRKRRVPVIKNRDPHPTGHCSKSDIRRKVRRRVGVIRTCYERRLLARPNLRGKVTLRWTIGSDGRVSGVGHSGSLKDSSVTSCIKRAIRAVRFQKPDTGICVVKWPFVFDSGIR